jgi:glutathione peroxidase
VIASLDTYAVLSLIVNTASKCGFTPQYDIETPDRAYGDRGQYSPPVQLQSWSQKPGARQVQNKRHLAQATYDVTFPVFRATDVNGPNADPLSDRLEIRCAWLRFGSASWNFTKFLSIATAKVVRHASPPSPEIMWKDIEKLL